MGGSWWGEVQSWLWVAVWAYVGVLCRWVLGSLAASGEGTLLLRLGVSFFLPNIFGSFVMGIFVPMTELFRAHPPLYTGLTVGFCGSCTTFASWQALVAVSILNGAWVDGLLQSLITFATSLLAYSLGQEAGLSLAARICGWCERHSQPRSPDALPLRRRAPTPPPKLPLPVPGTSSRSSQLSLSSPPPPPPLPPSRSLSTAEEMKLTATAVLVFAVASVAVWSGLLFDVAVYRLHWWAGVAFGPAGACLRFGLSKLNRLWPDLPAMTLVANLSASFLNVCLLLAENRWFSAQRYAVPRTDVEEACLIQLEGRLTLDVVRWSWLLWAYGGLSGGFSGSLSTVSTWIKEIYALGARSRWLAARYALVSVLGAQLLCLSAGGLWMISGQTLSPVAHPNVTLCRAQAVATELSIRKAKEALHLSFQALSQSY